MGKIKNINYMKDRDYLKANPLTPEQLKEYYKTQTGEDLSVVMMNDVKKTDTLDSLFKNNNCFVLYIPVRSEYNGHFVSLFKNKKGIYFLDSYGNTPAQLFKNIHIKLNVELFKKIAKSGIPCYFSEILYQTKAEDVADCGRYAVTNCILHTLYGKKGDFYDLTTFNKKLIEYMKQNNLKDYDDAIVDITKDL